MSECHPAISIRDLGKLYRLGQVGTGTLSHDLNRWWHRVRGKDDPYLRIGEENRRETQGGGEFVWALKDISLDVRRGEVLGIIGRNGAGKSTLLKVLSKVTGPTTGSIKIRGRIASLLEVGTGFHPELTGRENIYLNGTILGMTTSEVSRMLDGIVEFAGVARYLDTPVKRYSSGMVVRLGFAVAAHLQTDILVVDEVLAVGDAGFQKRALGKMQEISAGSGRTVLFVSHNMMAVQALCGRAILLEGGRLCADGPVEHVVGAYLDSVNHPEEDIDRCPVAMDGLVLRKVLFQSEHERSRVVVRTGDLLRLILEVELAERMEDLMVGVAFYDHRRVKLTEIGNRYLMERTDLDAGQHRLVFEIPSLPLPPGRYYVNLSIATARGRIGHLEEVRQFLVEEGRFFDQPLLPPDRRVLFYLPFRYHQQ
jgi:lipopolysaccharide transport system ATP-binding protein